MKELVLHIGTHKTGTTSLQRFMRENAALLERQGVGVPRMPGKFPLVSRGRNGFFLDAAARKAYLGQDWHPDLDKPLKKNRKVFRKAVAKHDRVLLSDEHMWYEGAQDIRFWESVKKIAEEDGITSFKIIVYLRRQEEVAGSLWSQRVKERKTDSVQKYVKSRRMRKAMDYAANLRMLEECFGREALDVRLYDKARTSPGGLYQDFCKALGVDGEGFVEPEWLNSSMTRNHTEIKRIANGTKSYAETGNFLRRVALNVSEGKREDPVTFLTPELVGMIAASYAEGNAEVIRKYFDDADGSLLEPVSQAGEEWSMLTPEMMHDICAFFVEALSIEHARRRELQARVRHLELIPHNALFVALYNAYHFVRYGREDA